MAHLLLGSEVHGGCCQSSGPSLKLESSQTLCMNCGHSALRLAELANGEGFRAKQIRSETWNEMKLFCSNMLTTYMNGNGTQNLTAKRREIDS